MARGCVAACLVAMASLTAPGAARADRAHGAASDDERRAEARAHYAEAERHFAAGEFAEAYTEYRAANDLISAPQTLYKMAIARDKQGLVEETIAGYEAFLAAGPPPAMDEKAAAARERLGELKKRVPVRVHLRSDPPGAEVSIDGAPTAGTTPFDAKVVPGAHKVRFMSAGHAPVERDLEVVAGRPGDLLAVLPVGTVDAPPAPAVVAAAAAPVAPPEAPRAESRSRTLPYALLGGAVVGAAVGTVFGLRALSSKRDFEAAPTGAQADKTERDALIADIAFGAGLTVGVTGLVLLLAQPATEKPAAASVWHLAPVVGSSGAGAVAAVRF